MNPDFDITNAEIWRVVARIETKLDEALRTISTHDTDLAVMKAEKNTLLWIINGLYLAVIAAIEWFHK